MFLCLLATNAMLVSRSPKEMDMKLLVMRLASFSAIASILGFVVFGVIYYQELSGLLMALFMIGVSTVGSLAAQVLRNWAMSHRHSDPD